MNTYDKLIKIQKENSSILCVGLDSDLSKIPDGLKKDVNSLFEFNKQIIDATKDLACAYKLNFAFYEQYGAEGYEVLKKTFDYIPDKIIKIADAKRGDIGNTSTAYAKSCFDYFGADILTVNPYLGKDSVEPFLEYKHKMTCLLTITSNPGSANFQRLKFNGIPLYRQIVEQSLHWADSKQLGYIIGATHSSELSEMRELMPDRVLLIPGIGTQGGSVESTIKANNNGTAIINISRAIIYASKDKDFAAKARDKAYKFKLSFI